MKICVIENCGGEVRDRRAKRCDLHKATCAAPACEYSTENMSGIYCSMHFARKIGKVARDFLAPKIGDTGQWRDNGDGYIVREALQPDGSRRKVFQHRVVMEEHLGRPLRKNENVHHINGRRAQNNIENLELWVKNQPAGQRMTDLVEWAREIMETYGAEAEQEARRLNR